MKVNLQDIYGENFEIELTEPHSAFHLKELLFQLYGRNANNTILVQGKQKLDDYFLFSENEFEESILIFDEGAFRNKCFPSVSDAFSYTMNPFSQFVLEIPRFEFPLCSITSDNSEECTTNNEW